jgi:hypothetical protein
MSFACICLKEFLLALLKNESNVGIRALIVVGVGSLATVWYMYLYNSGTKLQHDEFDLGEIIDPEYQRFYWD